MSEVDRSLVSAAGMVVSGEFAEYAGRVFPVTVRSRTMTHLEMSPSMAERCFPGAETRQSQGGYVRVVVPITALDRYFHRSILAWWRGAHRVFVQKLVGDNALFSMSAPTHIGRELGLSGDQYSGWLGECPISELSYLEQEIKEYRLS